MNNLERRLQIIIVTYNRCQYLKNTLSQLFNEHSPVKNCAVLVLDNCSSDNTKNIVENFQIRNQNLSYQCNRINIGGNANVARAIELAELDYIWILADDDTFDFSGWNELEQALDSGYEVVCVANYGIPINKRKDLSYQLIQLTFVPGAIYSTALLNATVLKNVYDSIVTMFPQLCPFIYHINSGKEIYVLDTPLVVRGTENDGKGTDYFRGVNREDVFIRSESTRWISGFCSIIVNLKDKELVQRTLDIVISLKEFYGSSDSFYSHVKNLWLERKGHFPVFIELYCALSDYHKKELLTLVREKKKEYVELIENNLISF